MQSNYIVKDIYKYFKIFQKNSAKRKFGSTSADIMKSSYSLN